MGGVVIVAAGLLMMVVRSGVEPASGRGKATTSLSGAGLWSLGDWMGVESGSLEFGSR